MAIDVTPRISFSHDLTPNDAVFVEHHTRSSSSSTTDFDFCVSRQNPNQESSSADELFFDGKILPIETKKRLAVAPPLRLSADVAAQPPLPPKAPPPPRATYEDRQQNHKTPSFWRFKRSASLNCGSGYATSLCPLPPVVRSSSTGATASVNRPSSNNNQKQNFEVMNSLPTNKHKPPLKKNGTHCSYNGGVKINPIYNFSSPNLLCFGPVFSAGFKYKGKKKSPF